MNNLLAEAAPPAAEQDEEYMNAQQKAHFRELLLNWKRELVEESRRTVQQMQNDLINLPDINDRASQEEEFALALRARDRERKMLRKIDKSLSRLASDDYGYCESCGVEIGLSRLQARPTAELCIDCKHLEEEKEKSQAT